MIPIDVKVKDQGQTTGLWKNVLFSHYFLTPLLELESCLAWYNECPLKVNNPYGCSYHMCKGQGQTGGLWQNVWSIFKTSITWQWLNLDQ